MPDLTSIIIPAWAWDDHTRQLAVDTARNIRNTTTGQYELIVVYAGVDAENLPELCDQFIRIDPPQGWAAASNIGLLAAEGSYLVVGSVDIRVPKGWLPTMRDAAGKRTVVSPHDYKANGKTRRQWDQTGRGSFWGGWFLFHRRILETVGFFDGYMMRRKADMDWALRARYAGFDTVRVPVKARHVEPHHTLVHPDPYKDAMRVVFKEAHGVDMFGEFEGLEV